MFPSNIWLTFANELHLITEPKHGLARDESSLCPGVHFSSLSLSRFLLYHTNACPWVEKPPSPRTYNYAFIHLTNYITVEWGLCLGFFPFFILLCSLLFSTPLTAATTTPKSLFSLTVILIFFSSQVMDGKSPSFPVLWANYDCSLVGYSSLMLKILSKNFLPQSIVWKDGFTQGRFIHHSLPV